MTGPSPLGNGDVLVDVHGAMFIIVGRESGFYIQSTGIGGPVLISSYTPSVVALPATRMLIRNADGTFQHDSTVFTELPERLPPLGADEALAALRAKLSKNA